VEEPENSEVHAGLISVGEACFFSRIHEGKREAFWVDVIGFMLGIVDGASAL
jgi:hypothetical protein